MFGLYELLAYPIYKISTNQGNMTRVTGSPKVIRYLSGWTPGIDWGKVGIQNSPTVPKHPPTHRLPHPTFRSSIQTARNRPVFSCAKSPESRIKPRTGTFEKTPLKTRWTGRSCSAGSGQSEPGIGPDGHFRGHECDRVTTGDQVSHCGGQANLFLILVRLSW